MTRDEAKRHIELMFDYHFIYSKETDNLLPFSGHLKHTVFDIQTRLYNLIHMMYEDFDQAQEGLRYEYEETITGLISQGEEDYV